MIVLIQEIYFYISSELLSQTQFKRISTNTLFFFLLSFLIHHIHQHSALRKLVSLKLLLKALKRNREIPNINSKSC